MVTKPNFELYDFKIYVGHIAFVTVTQITFLTSMFD